MVLQSHLDHAILTSPEERFVDLLMERQLISADDALTFKVREELKVEHESCWHLHVVEWIQFDMRGENLSFSGGLPALRPVFCVLR